MKKIKIAQIGINRFSHSNEIFGSICKQNELFDVVGCVFPENEKERIINKYERIKSYPELILEDVLSNPEIEAVTIETDEIYLTKYAIMAAKAGKHIHMEKPGGINLAEFEELVSIMKKSGKILHLGYMYRYNPFIIKIINEIKNGELGEILSVEAGMNCIHSNETRFWLNELPGGIMFYLGCHLIDLVLQIKGPPKKIVPFNKSSGIDGIDSKDSCMAVFEYENGTSFIKTTSCEIGGYARRQFVVSGTKGTVELKPFEMYDGSGKLYTAKTEYKSSVWNDMGESSKTEMFDRYDGMMAAFASYINGEKENPYTLDYELELYKTILEVCGGEI